MGDPLKIAFETKKSLGLLHTSCVTYTFTQGCPFGFAQWANLKDDKQLKELEHRKLGWKVLILKYDLGKSLS